MSASFNQCTFVGRLGKDPDFNVTPSGTPVAKFSLAVDQYKGKDKDGNPLKDTLWLNIVTWNSLAETVEKYAEKGRLVLVQGRLQIESYIDKEGIKRNSVQIVAGSVQLLEKRETNTARGNTFAEFDPFGDALPE
ncbi:MAG TPA: single-stranded DNA-binding protein [Ktedonobacteraceae bacterium]|nr:single-stranded DNA-binding protein [Ktedonobacteraceae bacterium]